MTDLSKAVRRVSPARDAHRRIVVILGPGDLIGFRLERGRHVFESTISACYHAAVRAEVLAAKAAKRKA